MSPTVSLIGMYNVESRHLSYGTLCYSRCCYRFDIILHDDVSGIILAVPYGMTASPMKEAVFLDLSGGRLDLTRLEDGGNVRKRWQREAWTGQRTVILGCVGIVETRHGSLGL